MLCQVRGRHHVVFGMYNSYHCGFSPLHGDEYFVTTQMFSVDNETHLRTSHCEAQSATFDCPFGIWRRRPISDMLLPSNLFLILVEMYLQKTMLACHIPLLTVNFWSISHKDLRTQEVFPIRTESFFVPLSTQKGRFHWSSDSNSVDTLIS